VQPARRHSLPRRHSLRSTLPAEPLRQGKNDLPHLPVLRSSHKPLTPTLSPQAGRGGIAWLCKRNTDLPQPRLPAEYFAIPKIAATACYRYVMLALIFDLAVGSVACVVGAVAARPSQFPAASLLEPVAGKIFSLPERSGNLAQRLDITGGCRSNGADFGAETKSFPAVSLLAGKIAAASLERAQPEDAVGL